MRHISILKIAISLLFTINFLYTCASWIDAQHEIKTAAFMIALYETGSQAEEIQQRLLRRAEYYHTGWTIKLIIEFSLVVLVWIFNFFNKGLKKV